MLALGVPALSCGSVSTLSDAGSPGAAGSNAGGTTGSGGSSAGGTTGSGGSGGTGGASVGGTTGTAGNGSMGGGGGIRPDGGADAGPLACHLDLNDCPMGSTCACGGPGPGVCTCHKNCSDTTQCPAAEPMCGCPSTTGGTRFCVNACFCSCQ
jgi:hypothetical protein